MHIEDTEKDADPLPGAFGGVDGGRLGHQAVAGRHNQPGAGGNRPLGIAEEPEKKRRQEHGRNAPRPTARSPRQQPRHCQQTQTVDVTVTNHSPQRLYGDSAPSTALSKRAPGQSHLKSRVVLKGHDFSRAVKQPGNSWALAPEEWFGCIENVPQRLKPAELSHVIGTAKAVPFQNMGFFHNLENPCPSVPIRGSKCDCPETRTLWSHLQNSIEVARSVRARLQSCCKFSKNLLGFRGCGKTSKNRRKPGKRSLRG